MEIFSSYSLNRILIKRHRLEHVIPCLGGGREVPLRKIVKPP
jgi:hypothetical protein